MISLIHLVKPQETLHQISNDYRVPISTLISVNPSITPKQLYIGQPIYIPGIPDPNTISYHIEISLRNHLLTLYNYGFIEKQFPIAVGRMLHNTPMGHFIIVNKQPNPGGPFGTMWMSLSKLHYGIHGTNNPSSIGKAVSKGCIRMHNQDVEELSKVVPIGTSVTIHQ